MADAEDPEEIRSLDADTKRRLEDEIRKFGVDPFDLREIVRSMLVHCELCDRDLRQAGLTPRSQMCGARRRARAYFDLTHDDIVEEANEIGSLTPQDGGGG